MLHKGGVHQTNRMLVSGNISYLKTPMKVIGKINLPNIELEEIKSI